MPKDRLFAATNTQQSQNHPNGKSRLASLPSEVQRSVPQCAQQCLAFYVGQQYNCPDHEFNCLCDRYSSEGFALGELAYACIIQDCGDESTTISKEAYFVCHSVSQAAKPTHSTLTLPAPTTTRPHPSTQSTSTTTKGPIPTSHDPTLRSSHTSSATTARTALSAADGSPQPSPSAAAEAGRSTSTALSATHLTAAQSAGISIAAMGAVIMVIALIWLIAVLRRKKVTKKDERKSYDFVDEAPPRFSPFNYGIADPRGPLGGFQKRRAELMAEKRTSDWARSHYAPDNAQRHEKSVDISPDTYRSNDSKRSQLLPDKPYSTIFRSYPKSPAPTTTTIFEEDRPQAIPPPVPSLRSLPRLPPAGQAIYYPPPPPTKSRMVQYAQQYQNSPEKPRQPSLSLDIPRQAARLPRAPSPVAFPLPPNVPAPSRRGRDPSVESHAKSGESEGSLLNYYASPEAGFDTSPEDLDTPATPIDDVIQRRRAAPNAITITKPVYPPRAIRVDSNGSDTSFESNISDEPTPPEEIERQLTPVLESPISRVKYPKIPRSSNQAVARSPKNSPGLILSPLHIRKAEVRPFDGRIGLPSNPRPPHRRQDPQPEPVTPPRSSPALSGSTLAAKRLGNSAAQDLERRLYISDSSHSRSNSNATTKVTRSEPNSGKSIHQAVERNAKAESPLKGYGRIASGGRQASRGQLGSPLWEPKLTPSRKGEDLYLSVGVATPMTAAFTPAVNCRPH